MKAYKKFSNHDPDCDDGDEYDDGDICGYICFAVGTLLLFLTVGTVATLIVLGADDRHSISSLTSSHPAKSFSSGIMGSLLNEDTMRSRVTENIPDTIKKRKVDLLILVHSLPKSSSARNTVRQTWMKTALPGVQIFFVIPARSASANLMDKITEESIDHEDMVMFLDGPVLPESEMLLLEFQWAKRTMQFSYFMKMRDSMYVRMEALVNNVLHKLKETDSNAYLGYFQAQQSPREKGTSKHPEPDWFLCDDFIRFAHSGGYILSAKLVDRLSAQATVLYPYNNEDVALGTWLSPYNDIDWVHDIRFDTELGKKRGCRNDWIVFPSSDMVIQHKRLLTGGGVCLVEYEDIETYTFNFDTYPSKCCNAVTFN